MQSCLLSAVASILRILYAFTDSPNAAPMTSIMCKATCTGASHVYTVVSINNMQVRMHNIIYVRMYTVYDTYNIHTYIEGIRGCCATAVAAFLASC